jgi:uncharacterized protein YbjT (DUF2867 family)
VLAEQAVGASGAELTILRSAWFMQNFSEGFMLEHVLSGQVYEVTGPRLMTFSGAVDEIANAGGRELRYAPVSIDEYVATATEQGVPAAFVALLVYLFSEVLDGRNAQVADGVQRALGRGPRGFADYARYAALTGVWDVSVVTN